MSIKYNINYIPKASINEEFYHYETPHKTLKIIDILQEYIEVEGYNEELGFYAQKGDLPCYQIDSSSLIQSFFISEQFDADVLGGTWCLKSAKTRKIINIDRYKNKSSKIF